MAYWYSKNGNYPRANSEYDSMSKADLLLMGIKRVDPRPENKPDANPPEYFLWDGNILDWVLMVESTVNNDYYWEQIMSWRVAQLAAMDIIALRELEADGKVSENAKGYRQFLRDITDNHSVPYTFQYESYEEWIEQNA